MSLVIAIAYSTVQHLNQSSPQSIEGAFYIITAQIVFRTSYSVQHVFRSQMPILRREVGENVYDLSAYYVAAAISNVPTHCVDVVIILVAFYMFSGFFSGLWLFCRFVWILLLTAITSNAYGFMASSLFDSKRSVAEITPLFDTIFTLMSGKFVSLHNYPYLKLISVFYYTSEAMSLTYWHNVTDIGEC